MNLSDIVQDKIKFQSEIYSIVIAKVENSKSKIEIRKKPYRRAITSLSDISNFKVITRFVSRVINAKNSKPNKSNAHDSKKRDKMLNFLSISGFKSKTVGFLRFKNTFNRAKTMRITSNSTLRRVIGKKIARFLSRRIGNNNSSFKQFSSKKDILKDFRMLNNRANVSKMRSSKEAFRIIVRKSKERFRANGIKATDRLNMRKNINMRKPPIGKKNDMIIFKRKERSTKRDTRFN